MKNEFSEDFLCRSREILLVDDEGNDHAGVFITRGDAAYLYAKLKEKQQLPLAPPCPTTKALLSLFAAFAYGEPIPIENVSKNKKILMEEGDDVPMTPPGFDYVTKTV